MSEKTNTAPSISKPQTQVHSNVVMDIDRLKPDPDRVEKERRDNTWSGAGTAAFGLGSTAFIGHALFTAHSAKPKSSTLWGVIAAIVAAPIGAMIGHAAKTQEEERSETLIRAAKSGQFEAALKYYMEQRERRAANINSFPY